MATGGSYESVTLKGRLFAVAADADSNMHLGGYSNALEANGNGTARLLKTRTTWMVDGIALEIDDLNGDLEFLQNLANENEPFTCVFSKASGAVYEGQGQIVEEINASSATATAPITFRGPGNLTLQV